MKYLLMAAHPGHELLLWKWLRIERPQVVILTNGAGANGVPRLEPTLDNLQQSGAQWMTKLLQPVSDAAIYQALLDGDTALFRTWVDALAAHVVAQGIECIVADESEDYNPSHDLCRLLANRVANRARAGGHAVESFGYPTVGHPCPPARLAAETHRMVELGPTELQHKLGDMQGYARRAGGQLQRELDSFISEFGEEAYGRECLFAAQPTRYEQPGAAAVKPLFERIGEERVAAGVYKHVIRGAHLQAVADELAHGTPAR
ncbi:hypothetical protein [Variovorax sp. OV329]|uniref:hypothetical protein n=1 Tax=Variovorax sp. OV329 TaxID=1882825 RepID=UPI0008EC1812|nr:hypothetical protein [Variovorax sp. OV329]SFM78205.1 hypothetical protein SAMN05444747_108262 [Variovorax sp. OV329]